MCDAQKCAVQKKIHLSIEKSVRSYTAAQSQKVKAVPSATLWGEQGVGGIPSPSPTCVPPHALISKGEEVTHIIARGKRSPVYVNFLGLRKRTYRFAVHPSSNLWPYQSVPFIRLHVTVLHFNPKVPRY